MKYKKLVKLGLIVLLVVLANFVVVKMVYANKITGKSAQFFARLYNLKIGVIHEPNQDLAIYLSDYFENVNFVNEYLKAKIEYEQSDVATEEDDIFDPFAIDEIPKPAVVDKVIWDKLVKEAWIAKVARENEITLSEEEIEERMHIFGDSEKIKKTMEESYGLSFDLYKEYMIKPAILEAEVYASLIENYKDVKGVQKIQEAWAWLEQGGDFDETAKKYSEDMSFIDNTLWLTEGESSGLYESVRDLEVGDFSKIVQLPIGYVIWNIETEALDEETQKEAKEVRGIFVASKSFDSFYTEYLNMVDIERKFKI
ncbi:hypothetical protein HON36_03485 [Candidatus Parcubacteria bacterium]|jgi:hypothetical protein|nr:hypothetical protein [Candidatus Parcubacteria bacterium]MBT7228852.1 hypothetical protein [Candidatus Parcubacteria bacterium]